MGKPQESGTLRFRGGSYNRPGLPHAAWDGEPRQHMVELITLQEALAFSTGALLFGLITMRLRPEFRRSILVTLLLIALGRAASSSCRAIS